MVQPNYIPDSPDFPAHQRAIVDAMTAALASAGVRRVVALSSWGADKPAGTGPVVGLHHLEQHRNVRHRNPPAPASGDARHQREQARRIAMGESLDLLLDERAITRLLVTHCASIDDGRFDVTASLYADATWGITDGKPLHGTEAVTAFLNVHARNIRTSTRADPPTAQSPYPRTHLIWPCSMRSRWSRTRPLLTRSPSCSCSLVTHSRRPLMVSAVCSE